MAARTSRTLAAELVRITQRVAERAERRNGATQCGKLESLGRFLSATQATEISDDDFVDACAQAAVWNCFLREAAIDPSSDLTAAALRTALEASGSVELAELLESEDERELRQVGAHYRECYAECGSGAAMLIHCFEDFLQLYSRQQRRRKGVFYTPAAVVRFIVRQVDSVLRREFRLADGLADTTTWIELAERHPKLTIPAGVDGRSPFVRILDPAAGTGAFLVEVVRVVHETMVTKWRHDGGDASEILARWNDYVPRHLLPRLVGLELMLAPAFIARANVALCLAETGYRFGESSTLRIHVTNTLLGSAAEHLTGDLFLGDEYTRELTSAHAARARDPITVIVGNPPFSAASNNRHAWIENLIRGRTGENKATSNYYEVDDQPLGERKLWLHDDYVKFIRYAQWRIESSGCGVLGFVTNHGYLDNPTFRGMRQQLSRAFSRIEIVDLHGNRKKKERPPDGGADENVFGIDQGVAIGIFTRPVDPTPEPTIRHAELWGDRASKFARLEAQSAGSGVFFEQANVCVTTRRLEKDCRPLSVTAQLHPQRPFYFFVPHNDSRRGEYECGFKLTDIMPVSSTAAVTARDGFVVAFDENQLRERMSHFCDLGIADDEIRRRYFNNTRSRHHQPGDTRGWKLAEVRRRLVMEANGASHTRPFVYRPFDRRFIYWNDAMVDWPRGDIMRHMTAGENLALVARRQMPPGQPCRYFWISDGIVLDGLIRSDNRGSEFFVPLYLYDEAKDDRPGRRRANFDSTFIATAAETLGLSWLADGRGDLSQTFGPEDLFNYIYALFHSTAYRQRYADLLRIDFPRVFLPSDSESFRVLSGAGQHLIRCHLLRNVEADSPLTTNPLTTHPLPCVIGRGFPKYQDDRIYVDSDNYFSNVPRQVWELHVGAHQVARKWLKDRRGRRQSEADIAHYENIVAAIRRHIAIVASIDEHVADNGGWANAFQVR